MYVFKITYKTDYNPPEQVNDAIVLAEAPELAISRFRGFMGANKVDVLNTKKLGYFSEDINAPALEKLLTNKYRKENQP